MSGIRVASGHMFFFFAYDAGFEIALEKARALCEASDSPGIAGLRPAPAETLELIIILLIAIEIVMGLLRW